MPKFLVKDGHCGHCGVELIMHQEHGYAKASEWNDELVKTHCAKLIYAWKHDSGLYDGWFTRRELDAAITKHYPGFTNKARLAEAVGCELVMIVKNATPPLYQLNRSRVKELFPQLD